MTDQPRGASRASLSFIFITILIETIGIGIIIPVLPKLVKEFLDGDTEVASEYFGGLIALYALMQFLFAPMLGALSDRFGRRPVLLVSLVGQGIDYFIMFMAPSLLWLAIGRGLAGISGASITTAQAYIADVTRPEKRAQSFGLIGVAFGVGFILGPALGGVLGDLFGLRTPFLAAGAFSLLNALYGLFVLPESLPKHKRTQPNLREANPLAVFPVLKRLPNLVPIVVVYSLIMLAGQVMPATWVLYTEYQFGWDESTTGWSLAVVGLAVGLVQGLLVKPVNARLGERATAVVGISSNAIILMLIGFATQSWMLFALIAPYALGGLAGPATQSLASRSVSDREQGKLQGILTGLMGLVQIAGPLLFTFAFAMGVNDAFTWTVPGLAFFGASGISLVAALYALNRLPGSPAPPAHSHPAHSPEVSDSASYPAHPPAQIETIP